MAQDAESGMQEHEIDPAMPWAYRLGLIVLQTDETIEQDFRIFTADPSIALYHTRIPSSPTVTTETLRQMENHIPSAASLLLKEPPLSVIGYGCTSASTVLGETRVQELVQSEHPGVPVTNPLSALKAAAAALGVTHLGLVSPYIRSVTDALEGELSESGTPFVRAVVFGREEENLVARIAPHSILSAAEKVAADPQVEAVFASCTNLRASAVIADAEQATGKPFLCSNQVLAWHMLRLAGITRTVPELGRLGSLGLAREDTAPLEREFVA
jgi:maleate isomerase